MRLLPAIVCVAFACPIVGCYFFGGRDQLPSSCEALASRMRSDGVTLPSTENMRETQHTRLLISCSLNEVDSIVGYREPDQGVCRLKTRVTQCRPGMVACGIVPVDFGTC